MSVVLNALVCPKRWVRASRRTTIPSWFAPVGSAQLAPGVLQHRDQSGPRFLRRADRLGKRQADGPRSLPGLRRHLEPVTVDGSHTRGGDLGRLRKDLAVEDDRV